MKRTLINLAVLAALTAAGAGIRARTTDVAFTYRMGAGNPGDVNRAHPASILPGLMDVTNPIAFYGNPVLINTAANSYRQILPGDTAVTKIAGVLVRPYPTQQTTGGMAAAFGTAVPPVTGVVDVINLGFVMVKVNNFATTNVTKGGAVFVWVAASSGAHVQGGFESVANGANTIAITNALYNGPSDANGVAELQVWSA
jgi:hypothetical protein